VLPGRAQLGLHIRLLSNDLLKLDDGGVKLEDLLALSYKRYDDVRALLLTLDSRSLTLAS